LLPHSLESLMRRQKSMKMRYRKPSLKTLLGVTKAKRQIGRSTGLYSVTKAINKPKNMKRLLMRKAGYESEIMKIFRLLRRLFK
jgi:hypothetical protein